jgi:hypothetical protein
MDGIYCPRCRPRTDSMRAHMVGVGEEEESRATEQRFLAVPWQRQDGPFGWFVSGSNSCPGQIEWWHSRPSPLLCFCV